MRIPSRTLAGVSGLVLAAGAAWAGEAAYDAPVNIDLTFLYHIDKEMPEQDVFVEREPGSGQMWRATKGDQNMSQPIYASVEPLPHDPANVEANGPYPTGPKLGMTLGEWFEGKGAGTYACVDGQAEIDVTFTGLVPNGVYTMWHWFSADPPTEPFKEPYDLPVGSRDGAESAFVADDEGNATYRRTFKPCLQLSGEHLMSGLAAAWHSDGRTYGPHPGEFAKNAHVQLFLVLPKRAGI